MKWLVRFIVGLLGGKERGRVVKYSPLSFNKVDGESVKTFVFEWNSTYPIDHWWRDKHNVAFNSAHHREVSFLDMKVEWEEDRLYRRIRGEEVYKINSGDFFKRVDVVEEHLSEEEQMKNFLQEEKEMDYSQYNDKAVEQKKG